MKICFLTDDPSLIGGGPEHIRHVSGILRKKYHCQVEIITPLTVDSNFNLHNFWHRVRFALWVPLFLLTSNYDIYHSHSFSTSLFLPLAKLRDKKIGVTVHGVGVNLISGGVLNKLGIFKVLMNLILNRWPYDFRLSAGKLPGYRQIGNGVDVAEFDKEKAKPNPKYFTVLCVSRRDPVKGVGILEKAIKIVQKKYPNVRLNLVSGRHRTAKDFKTANLYVLPSLSEGFPIVLLEAMAAKLPVVATDVGDCRTLIEKARAGLVVPPKDADALAKAVGQMLIKQDRFGQNGYNFVKNNYTWRRVTQKVYAAYQKTLRERIIQT